jgi:ABC-type sugar transport system permease subunit/ABC-type glycerol-3-phosphate transport system substrate-binding protein
MLGRWNGWIRGAFWGAVALTVVWALHPRPSAQFDDGATVIRLMAPEGPVGDAMEDALREFEFLSRQRHEATGGEYPVYRVVAGQHASRNQVEDPTRFLLSLVGGEPPDVILFDRFAISEWAAKGAFTPLDDRVARDLAAWDAWQASEHPAASLPPWPGALEEPPRAIGAASLPAIHPVRQEDFYPACWDEAVFNDPHTGSRTLYGIPFNADDRALLYNKDILVRHGYTNEFGEARPPRTWEELEEMAVAMTERDARGTIQTIGFIPNFGNSWLYLYGWQAGGEFMSADGRTCTLNSPELVRALEFMTRIYDRLGGVKDVYAFQSTFQGDALDPFVLGKVAMKIDGVWIMESLARFGLDLDFGLAPPPMPADELAKGRAPISWVGGWAYAIPSTAKEKDGAWELMRFLVSRRSLRIVAASSEHSAAAQGQLYMPRQNPNREHNEWLHQTRIEDNPDLPRKFKDAMRVFNDLLETSRYRPVTPVGQKLWNAQIWAMEDAIFGKKTAREALDYYTAIVQRDLDAALNPPPGRPIRSWGWFFALYAALLAGVGVLVVRNDIRGTAPSARKRILRFLSSEEPAPAVIEGRKGSYFRAQWKDGVICALPWLLGFIFFTGGPLLFSIVISFSRFDILSDAVFIGLDNYRFMLTQDELFWKSLGNTLFMVIGVPLGMAVGLGMAILLTRKVRGVALWRTFFYLPSIVPVVASSILWIWIFNPQSGLINQLLASMGLAGPLWLQDEATSKWALILMGLWTAGGGMIIWIAGIKGISASYYEAASIDGASPWQQFVHITLPMLTPYIFFNLVMGLIGTFQVFTQAFIMTSGGPVNSTLFYVYHLFNNAFRYLNMGQACAMAWFLFLIVLALTALQLKLSARWVHYEEEN